VVELREPEGERGYQPSNTRWPFAKRFSAQRTIEMCTPGVVGAPTRRTSARREEAESIAPSRREQHGARCDECPPGSTRAVLLGSRALIRAPSAFHRYEPVSGTPCATAFALKEESRFTAVWISVLPSAV
jgi:hypothetical protein